jgi:hypothetical protein
VPAPARKSATEGSDYGSEIEDVEEGDLDELLAGGEGEQKKKKDRQKRRQLIFDEELGEVVAKRRRKGKRSREDWDEYLD